MQANPLFIAIALVTAAISSPLMAGDQDSDAVRERAETSEQRSSNGFDHGMQAVPHDATPGTRAYGWRYYSDPAARRAVVISPEGDYYYSRGKGLHWIAAEQT